MGRYLILRHAQQHFLATQCSLVADFAAHSMSHQHDLRKEPTGIQFLYAGKLGGQSVF